MNALGLIEVVGYLSAIKALDIALKSAYVSLIDIEKVGGGIVTVKITGDVDAVTEAVESAALSFENSGLEVRKHVIPRPINQLQKILFKDNYSKKIKNNQSLKLQEEINLVKHTNSISCEVEKDRSDSLKYSDLTKEKLLKMRAQDLKDFARRLKITGMTNKEIKMTKKNALVEKILKCIKEEVK